VFVPEDVEAGDEVVVLFEEVESNHDFFGALAFVDVFADAKTNMGAIINATNNFIETPL
jgi:hypothetical protein